MNFIVTTCFYNKKVYKINICVNKNDTRHIEDDIILMGSSLGLIADKSQKGA
jgi:hypothetical protein